MIRLLKLLSWELLIQNRINNFIKYLLSFFLFCTLCIALVNSYEDIRNFGITVTIIYVPISLIGFSNQIFKQDIEDGSMELILINFTASEISLIKYCALFINTVFGCLINLPIVFIAFNPSIHLFTNLVATLLLILMLSCTLLILIAAIQAYFRSNTNFLPTLIMTLIIPSIIIAGLILQNPSFNYLFFILIGINMILIPILIVLASYLIKNIYSFNA